jgi:transcription termination/antitermination protein NusA
VVTLNLNQLSGILGDIMPAVQRSEFALALNQVASERGVDITVVLDTVKNAILAAYRKDHPGIEIEEYQAELNPNTGEAHILHNKEDVTPPGFGRIAAQTAKQVILQKIREKEKEAILSDYRMKMGTVVNGMVLRFAGPNIIVDIGKTEALMPPQEQIPNEKYHLNQRLAVYLVEIHEGTRGEEVVVSRASNGIIEGLFKREVPEVAQGSVEIKAVVREPGNRSKVAVYSNQPGIDPVGSCVGQKGVRVQAIIQEFDGIEKIDIIQWSEDPKTYIQQALSPAKNVTVTINEADKVANVKVPQEELSLAIGQGGQNVRLASKLTGYRIEIEGEGEAKVESVSKGTEEKPISDKPKKEVSKETDETNVSEKNTVEEPKEEASETAEVEVSKEAKDTSDEVGDGSVAVSAETPDETTEDSEAIEVTPEMTADDTTEATPEAPSEEAGAVGETGTKSDEQTDEKSA